jgi:hypothetical protein
MTRKTECIVVLGTCVIAWALAGCGGNEPDADEVVTTDTTADTGGDADDATDSDADVAGDTTSDADADTAVEPDADAEVVQTPCLKIEPSGGSLHFGGVLLGITDKRDFSLVNCGSVDVVVTGIALKGDGTSDEFTLDFFATTYQYPSVGPLGPTQAKPLVIPGSTTATVSVRYDPKDITPSSSMGEPDPPDTDTVAVASNAGTPLLDLTAWGVKAFCPFAIVHVLEGEEVVPQTQLHLKGDQSYAPGGGTIKKYQWTAKQPAGSAKSFAPNAAFATPTFQPDAAGEYQFCLDVWDQNNTKSCTPACVTVLVVPNNAIHIELLWDTPADADQTDAGEMAGADVDLHFAHPLAVKPDQDCDGSPDPWFANPYDCFWFNPNPNWGGASAAGNDDPSMDLDDTDGAGPENLNLEQAEGTADEPFTYSIGVHSYQDNGYGNSFATVNLYLNGVLALAIAKVELEPLDMWYVGKLHWPHLGMGGSLPMFTVCKQSGDACIGAKDPTNPKGGAMWQASGDWCITPEYDSGDLMGQ